MHFQFNVKRKATTIMMYVRTRKRDLLNAPYS